MTEASADLQTEPSSKPDRGKGVYFNKSPKTLLSEWCQKNKRPAPKYKAVEVEGGFHCRLVIPDSRDSTKDTIFWFREFACATSQESQNRVAIIGLHWATGDRRMDLLLEDHYKAQWNNLETVKERAQQKEKEKEAMKKSRHGIPKKELHPVFMSEKNRQIVQDLFSASNDDKEASSSAMSGSDDIDRENNPNLLQQLLELGFREDRAKLALRETMSLSKALDWLVLNSADEELPESFAPNSSNASVLVTRPGMSQIDAPERHSSIILQKMTTYGYSDSEIAAADIPGEFEELEALTLLFSRLSESLGVPSQQEMAAMNEEELIEARQEELTVLESIYADELLAISPAKIALKAPIFHRTLSEELTFEVNISSVSRYPLELPLLSITGSKTRPAILSALTRDLVSKAWKLLGSCMIYDLYCHLVESGPQVLDNLLASEQTKKLEALSHHGLTSAAPREVVLQQVTVDSSVSEAGRQQREGKRGGGRQSAGINTGEESRRLSQLWNDWQKNSRVSALRQSREKLPAFRERKNVVECITRCSVTIICGQTGCGKSTQVPQYLLEDWIEQGKGGLCNIVCTQPRRISALGLADRVASERGEAVGATVGYSIRLDTKCTPRTRLLFCTAGVLLRRLLTDPDLDAVTHVVLDEVHERSLNVDLLLLLMKELLIRRRNLKLGPSSSLKLILMSATVDAHLFKSYFQDCLDTEPAVVTIPGFTFPVRELYLEDALELTQHRIGRNSKYGRKQGQIADLAVSDSHGSMQYSDATLSSLTAVNEDVMNYELIEDLVIYIVKESQGLIPHSNYGPLIEGNFQTGEGKQTSMAVLVFLPGVAEIRKLTSQLNSSQKLAEVCGSHQPWILPLHGSLPSGEQKRVFQKPPKGCWKIVVATNVAETSITIDDVLFVIDSGRVKDVQHSMTSGVTSLVDSWISRASAGQRRGRAGRVTAGCCIRLFSRAQFNKMDPQQKPEILRVNLDSLCLQVKSLLSKPVEAALSAALTSPTSESIRASIESLITLQALKPPEDLTPLGRHLSLLPLDPRLGKLLIYGCMLRCLGPILTIAAAMSNKSPFVSPLEHRSSANAAKIGLSGGFRSDHLATVQAYNDWLRAREDSWRAELEFCSSNFLSREALTAMEASRYDYVKVLTDLGFVPGDYGVGRGAGASLHAMDEQSLNVRVIKAVLCAGLYPNVVKVRHPEARFVQQVAGAVPTDAAAIDVRFFTKEKRVFLHPSSVNFVQGRFDSPWLVYSEQVQTSKLFVRETSMVPAYGLLLFGGSISVAHERAVIALDGWMEFQAPAKIAVLVKELRNKVDEALLCKIGNVTLNLSAMPVMDALIKLLTTDGF